MGSCNKDYTMFVRICDRKPSSTAFDSIIMADESDIVGTHHVTQLSSVFVFQRCSRGISFGRKQIREA